MIDPLTAANTFAGLVGLLNQFASSRSDSDKASDEDFLEWLSSQNHDELRILIEQNSRITISIKALLNSRLDQIEEKINLLIKLPGDSVSALPALYDLTDQIKDNTKLSQQAFEIVKVVDGCGAGGFVVHHIVGGVRLICLDVHAEIVIGEARFLQDDLCALVDAALIRPGQPAQGDPTYHLTRLGSNMAKAMKL